MKIAILSDFHFGYAYNTELEDDSFANADEALDKALDADLILIAGDIFDSRAPRIEVWARALGILVKTLFKSSGVRLVRATKDLPKISRRTLQSVPVIALHGTHERRGKGEINAIEALERVGLLIYLHRHTIIFEKGGQKVAIHGMSGVPDRYAHQLLSDWNPQPMAGCFNILMLHQSIEPFVWSPLETVSLRLSNLPRGFDLIVNGHVHRHTRDTVNSTTLLIPGSTVITQLEKVEAEDTKGFWQVEVGKVVKANFIPLKGGRKFFYEELHIEEALPVSELVKGRLDRILSPGYEKKPLVRMKLIGKESQIVEQELRDVQRLYADRCILRFVKELEAPEIARKVEFLRSLREKRLSIEEIGFRLLRQNLDELKFTHPFDYERMFRLLCEKRPEDVLNLLVGEQKTLAPLLKKSPQRADAQ